MANNVYITAGLSVSKNAGIFPGSGATAYISGGLPPVVLVTPIPPLTLNANCVITIGLDDTILFTGLDGEWGNVLISNHIFRVENDNNNFIWDSVGPDPYTFYTGEEDTTIKRETFLQRFEVTWLGHDGTNHQFRIEFTVIECHTTNLGGSLSAELVEDLNTENESPSGDWKDFGKWHKIWKNYRDFGIRDGIICPEDIPDEPKVEDYPNL